MQTTISHAECIMPCHGSFSTFGLSTQTRNGLHTHLHVKNIPPYTIVQRDVWGFDGVKSLSLGMQWSQQYGNIWGFWGRRGTEMTHDTSCAPYNKLCFLNGCRCFFRHTANYRYTTEMGRLSDCLWPTFCVCCLVMSNTELPLDPDLQTSNLLITFLKYSSIVMQDTKGWRLCLWLCHF